jgi:effector-binding domain-containing protein
MQITEPKIESRDEQPYVGIRTQVTMSEFSKAIDEAFPAVFAWLEEQGITPASAPFIRYHVIDMESKLDIEMGVPVASAVSGNGRVSTGIIPAGQYASLLYTGPYDGLMEANRVLIDWAKENGIMWDRWNDEKGDAFRSRLEIYHTDPQKEPDPANWKTEVAIKLADK